MKLRWNVFLAGLTFVWSGVVIILSVMFERKGFIKTVESLRELKTVLDKGMENDKTQPITE